MDSHCVRATVHVAHYLEAARRHRPHRVEPGWHASRSRRNRAAGGQLLPVTALTEYLPESREGRQLQRRYRNEGIVAH